MPITDIEILWYDYFLAAILPLASIPPVLYIKKLDLANLKDRNKLKILTFISLMVLCIMVYFFDELLTKYFIPYLPCLAVSISVFFIIVGKWVRIN